MPASVVKHLRHMLLQPGMMCILRPLQTCSCPTNLFRRTCVRSLFIPARAYASVPDKSLSQAARPLKRIKSNPQRNESEEFRDWCEVAIQGGNGGDGMCSFLALPMTEFAGPDGGDGGHGGHVYFEEGREGMPCFVLGLHGRLRQTFHKGSILMYGRFTLDSSPEPYPRFEKSHALKLATKPATSNQSSLNHLRPKIIGKSGEKGASRHCHGKGAQHTIIPVPLGTLFRDENGKIVAEVENEGDRFLAARGGAGGKGNAFFLSNEIRAPTVRERGGRGQTRNITVEMRVIAHAGLVGFPNAGKSSLLCAISCARPKVASYPFTTLHAHVGVIDYEDYKQIAVADIPGILPDAHKNYGLGIEFLRHVERCVCLLYVIDLSQPEPWLQYQHLRYELDMYRPGLADRPCAVVGNKIDLPEARANLAEFEKEVKLPVFAISAMKGTNVTALLTYIRKLYDDHHEERQREIAKEKENEMAINAL